MIDPTEMSDRAYDLLIRRNYHLRLIGSFLSDTPEACGMQAENFFGCDENLADELLAARCLRLVEQARRQGRSLTESRKRFAVSS